MQRTLTTSLLFAAAAILAVAATATFAYRGVDRAMTREFERRLEAIAVTAATQIAAADVGDARVRDEGGAYGAIQVQLATLRASTAVNSAAVLDSARVTLVDALAGTSVEGLPSSFDTLAHPALERAYAGHAAVSAPFERHGVRLRAAFAPIAEPGGRVAGVVAVEAAAGYLDVLADLRNTLTVIALVSLLAIAVFAALFLRNAESAARLERRLSRSENLAAMGRLTATLAHEIKNPLAIIRGSAQRLGKLEPEAERMAEFVVEESDRLTRTVSRYLQFARGEESSGESGDVLAALGATLDLLEGECAARQVRLERPAAPAGPARVGLDNESLKQVFLNLMLNALEAVPEGGQVRVAAAERGGRIEVSISDDGPGMDAETLKKLGSPFYTTKAKGSGLGLFLSRRLVASAGGRLEITSEAGRGTTCTVRLGLKRG
ncbi:MAG TPA: ATP-binding protein [Candidatus Saccharimonadaceae bacterium]|nr:ATP-binding protein [Candidatus Saccharimonadaceae bacterium]